MRVQLPGGLLVDRQLEREVRFREMTGVVEKCLRDCVLSSASRPVQVTHQLAAICSAIGSRPFTSETARALCIADRQFLMLKLTALQNPGTCWIHPSCSQCGELFDLEVPLDRLCAKEAGPSFPERNLSIRGHSLRVRVPTGGEQEAIAELDEPAALRTLLEACVLTAAGGRPEPDFLRSLADEEIEVIEAAIDEMAPGISTLFQVVCPVCQAEQVVEIDPYTLSDNNPDQLFEEVHHLALHYHWSEAAILRLPRERRHLYIRLIDGSRTLVT